MFFYAKNRRSLRNVRASVLSVGKKCYLCPIQSLAMTLFLQKALTLLFLFSVIAPAFAQKAKGVKLSRRERLRVADSLRHELRRVADEGRMLQWGDSLLRSRLGEGRIDESRYSKLRRRLYRYDKRLHRGDSLLSARYSKADVDTLYIVRPKGVRWTVKVRGNLSGAGVKTEGQRDGVPFKGDVRSDYRGTMSFAATYRGISLGFAINPAKLAGKSKDNEMNLVSYGNKFGFDAAYLSSKTYSGTVTVGDARADVRKGMVSQQAVNINAYYAFNGRRFSIPAAFMQSYVQRRSAGSFMVGLSFDGQKAEIGRMEEIGYEGVTMRILEIGVGAGYGYNFVAGKRWLFHISALPTFDVFVKSHVSEADTRLDMSYRFPSVIITSRGAAVYSWKQKFVGASMVFTNSSVGSRDNLHVMRDKWRLRVFYGFRF